MKVFFVIFPQLPAKLIERCVLTLERQIMDAVARGGLSLSLSLFNLPEKKKSKLVSYS